MQYWWKIQNLVKNNAASASEILEMIKRTNNSDNLSKDSDSIELKEGDFLNPYSSTCNPKLIIFAYLSERSIVSVWQYYATHFAD